MSETAQAPASSEPGRDALLRECLFASTGILLLLGLLKHGRSIPILDSFAFTVAAAAQLYIPIWLIGRRGITKAELGLQLRSWKRDLVLVAVLSLVTIVPFAIGHHFWQTWVSERTFSPRFPDKLGTMLVNHFLVVALAEEVYFRGYLQRRLEKLWPAQKQLFGTPFGLAIITASAVFALAHFVGEYHVARLSTFFPALLFGLLRTKTDSVFAPIVYHGFCNVLSESLFASYH